ncbi:aldo/keto reductase family protein [Bacillus sp. SCS-151]|uniref:aldo/keto reductase family protein n=1 Tax=Nanhaiella sioensis TaxID=3115293 RepID=UPI00397A5EAD
MKYRKLGNSGLLVSELSIGSWLTFGNYIDDIKSNEIVKTAYELGINNFDTANVYENGKAEELISHSLKDYSRDTYIISTKAYFPIGPWPTQKGLSKKHLTDQVNTSLKRMNLDYIDIFYCHRFDINSSVEETLRTLENLVRQGKILYIGVSKWTVEQMKKALEVADKYLLERIVVNQPPYNLLNRKIENNVIPWCSNNGISQIVYSPLAQGVLSGKYLSGSLNSGRTTVKNLDLSPAVLTKVQKLVDLSNNLDLNPAQLSLAWILNNPNITSAIIGASEKEHVIGNIRAIDVKLSQEVLQSLDEIFMEKEEEIFK